MSSKNSEYFSISAEDAGKRLDVWLTGKLGRFSRSYVEKLIADGKVKVGGKNVKTGYRLKAGDAIETAIPEPVVLEARAEEIPLEILYEDDDIIVVNKPRGMVVHPGPGNYSETLVNALLNHCGDSLSDINGIIRPGIVHRIDKYTSGVLVAAKNNRAHRILSEKLKEHDIKRVYVAAVNGIIVENEGKIDAPIGRHPVNRKKMSVNIKNGRKAITHFRVLERFKSATLLELTLETGRTHQIRVHLSYIGYPVIGDTVYGKKAKNYSFEGQALHARLLGFAHPSNGKYMEFVAEPPEEFIELVEKLRAE
ncbi:MAG: RluA family pseudouridine synthase [Acetivibrionales bacterium]|jgi:23S rRNA pseudouridine1911/1915/1917 synthase